MSATASTHLPVLHIWPGQWDLPSFDPLCLAAALYLQIAIRGKFTVTETSNPDSSPTGQLPFLIHGQHTVTSFPSIIKYISGLRNADYSTYPDADLDMHLTPRERSQRTAWFAHAESHLGDLVYHSLYSNQDNWTELTAATLGSMYPVPQKYYVPRRIRDSYHLRLQAAGLWQPFVEDPEKSKESPFSQESKLPAKEELGKNPKLSRAFNKEKILEKARATLDIYQELLGDREFFFNKWLSTLDILVAAHIILLTQVPYPDSSLEKLITSTYPSLHAHSVRVYASAFGQGRLVASPPESSLWALLPSLPKFHVPSQLKAEEETPEDRQYKNARMGFIGLAMGSLLTYYIVVTSRLLTRNH